MREAILKYRPEEFLVAESLILRRREGDRGRYTYARLRKSGYTTFEAVGLIARELDLPAESIRVAGLKDEDAVTEQMVAIEAHVPAASFETLNLNYGGGRRFLSLTLCGTGDEPIATGRLAGNSFRLVVRNLDRSFVDRVDAAPRHLVHFLNYYDVQRFGVADGPKTTHLLGEALLAEDYRSALDILRSTGTPEGDRARRFEGSAKQLFDRLDQRVVDFYRSSAASFRWNAQLADVVREVCGGETDEITVDTIPYTFSRRQALLPGLLRRRASLEYPRYYGDRRPGLRATVVQVQLLCNEIGEDEIHPGAFRCDLSFFLPSGCYATMYIKQLIRFLDLVPRAERTPQARQIGRD